MLLVSDSSHVFSFLYVFFNVQTFSLAPPLSYLIELRCFLPTLFSDPQNVSGVKNVSTKASYFLPSVLFATYLLLFPIRLFSDPKCFPYGTVKMSLFLCTKKSLTLSLDSLPLIMVTSISFSFSF